MLESSIDVPYLLIFLAIIAFQTTYILFQWVFIRRNEYLWYLAYMIGMGTYALMIYDFIPDLQFSEGLIINFKNTFDKAIPILSFFFYFRFARAFIGMEENFEALNKWIIRLENLLLVYIAIDLTWKALGQEYQAGESVYHIIAIVLFLSSWVLIIAFLRKKIVLSYFLVFGAVVLNVGNFFAMWLIVRQSMNLNVFCDPFLINSIAIIIDLLAFTTGLSYKVRLSEIEKLNLNKAYASELVLKLELQHEMIEIRHHIAKEIHEELGEGISDISIYAGIAQKDINQENVQIKGLINTIRSRSIEVLATLQDLIWTLSPENTSFKSLLAKIQQMQREELTPNNIPFKIQYSSDILDNNLKLPALKTSISTCRKIFSICSSANFDNIDMEFNGKEILWHVHFSSERQSSSPLNYFERIANNQMIEIEELPNMLKITLQITNYRY